MVTAVMEPTPPDGECLMFWYYMEGRAVGELTVYLRTPNGSLVRLWEKSGDQGNHWRHGRVQLHHQDGPYQVGLFVGDVSDNHFIILVCVVTFCRNHLETQTVYDFLSVYPLYMS